MALLSRRAFTSLNLFARRVPSRSVAIHHTPAPVSAWNTSQVVEYASTLLDEAPVDRLRKLGITGAKILDTNPVEMEKLWGLPGGSALLLHHSLRELASAPPSGAACAQTQHVGCPETPPVSQENGPRNEGAVRTGWVGRVDELERVEDAKGAPPLAEGDVVLLKSRAHCVAERPESAGVVKAVSGCVAVVKFPTARGLWRGMVSDIERLRATRPLREGENVRIKADVHTPRYQWGGVVRGDVGVLREIKGNGDCSVDFAGGGSGGESVSAERSEVAELRRALALVEAQLQRRDFELQQARLGCTGMSAASRGGVPAGEGSLSKISNGSTLKSSEEPPVPSPSPAGQLKLQREALSKRETEVKQEMERFVQERSAHMEEVRALRSLQLAVSARERDVEAASKALAQERALVEKRAAELEAQQSLLAQQGEKYAASDKELKTREADIARLSSRVASEREGLLEKEKQLLAQEKLLAERAAAHTKDLQGMVTRLAQLERSFEQVRGVVMEDERPVDNFEQRVQAMRVELACQKAEQELLKLEIRSTLLSTTIPELTSLSQSLKNLTESKPALAFRTQQAIDAEAERDRLAANLMRLADLITDEASTLAETLGSVEQEKAGAEEPRV